MIGVEAIVEIRLENSICSGGLIVGVSQLKGSQHMSDFILLAVTLITPIGLKTVLQYCRV